MAPGALTRCRAAIATQLSAPSHRIAAALALKSGFHCWLVGWFRLLKKSGLRECTIWAFIWLPLSLTFLLLLFSSLLSVGQFKMLLEGLKIKDFGIPLKLPGG